MEQALYGTDGFFIRECPAEHFRTSALTGRPFAAAVLRLLHGVDAALGRPARLDLVDVGAGRGELLAHLMDDAPEHLATRLRPVAVERAPRPVDLDPRVRWTDTLPPHLDGLLLATEWLDNVPLDIAVRAPDGWRYLTVRRDGAERSGPPVGGADLAWLRRWWPPPAQLPPWARAEIGRTRDDAWRTAVGALRRGLAVTVDYGHLRAERPTAGTLTGYHAGRQVRPVPDGRCDLTAHVALDSAAEAAGGSGGLLRQGQALRLLGVHGARPPLALAHQDPAGYLRALADAGADAELTDPSGLGGHYWMWHARGVPSELCALAGAAGQRPQSA